MVIVEHCIINHGVTCQVTPWLNYYRLRSLTPFARAADEQLKKINKKKH